MMYKRFEGKVVLITGAAGGIGSAAAKRFAQEGANVVAVDLEGSDLKAVTAAVEECGVECLAVAADVSRSADVGRYVAEATGRFGGIDIFLNNAGLEGWVGSSLDYPEEVFDKVLAVNVKGIWLGMKYVVPVMRERGGGVIINMSSTAGLGASPLVIAYGASKHAVIGMTQTAALEFAPSRIRVNVVCPSPIKTRMLEALQRGINPANPEAVQKVMLSNIPLGRYGEPSEVASLVAFLCSEEASYITGGIYTIDGGSRGK
ncbi:SDR family oxidoreductase [Sorangium sp. So ce429]